MGCTVTTVAAGGSFSCTITGPEGSKAQLQVTTPGGNAAIKGTVTSAAKTIRSAGARFDVTVPETVSGNVSVTAIVDGEAVSSARITSVRTVSAVSEVRAPADAGAPSGSTLSATGFDGGAMALGAGFLLVAGAASVVIAARRSSAGDRS
ncbi:hypothetical protein [Demequina soli]|uniref:hypothetical protein n=1 Tax=Demequina soli TaxID=1638987 RepID=UPI000780DF8B|nr:hypothetical protein [Demequina soli]